MRHAVEQRDRALVFPPGDYLLSKTIALKLAQVGRLGIDGLAGAAKVIMGGPGPAFHVIGSHRGTAGPGSVRPDVWAKERMPTARNIEIEGRHPEAIGLLVEGTMQATIEGVLLRDLKNGLVCRRRMRNLLVSYCHIYNNCDAGICLGNSHRRKKTSIHCTRCVGADEFGSSKEVRQVVAEVLRQTFLPTGEPFVSGTCRVAWVRIG